MTNVEVGQALTRAILANPDGGAVAAHYAERAELSSPAGTFEGRERIAAFFDEWFQSFSVVDINDTSMLEEGPMLLVEAITTLRHLESGKTVIVRGMEALEVDDGLVDKHRFYYDPQAVAAQLEQ